MPKIMLVEDDNNLREIYGARLMAEGYDIVTARDGEEALALAVKEKPDLIISDVMMPKISGFDMLDILRTTAETKDTKVIMMTALSQAEDKARADKLGADRYLVKSQVTLEDVANTVKAVLADQKATNEQIDPISAPAMPITPIVRPMDITPAPIAPQPAPQPQQQAAGQMDPAAIVAAISAPTTVITPAQSAVIPAPTNTAQEPTVPAPINQQSSETTKKKIIQPLNDITKSPNLGELLQKEIDKENRFAPVLNPLPGNHVQQSTPEPAAQMPSLAEQPLQTNPVAGNTNQPPTSSVTPSNDSSATEPDLDLSMLQQSAPVAPQPVATTDDMPSLVAAQATSGQPIVQTPAISEASPIVQQQTVATEPTTAVEDLDSMQYEITPVTVEKPTPAALEMPQNPFPVIDVNSATAPQTPAIALPSVAAPTPIEQIPTPAIVDEPIVQQPQIDIPVAIAPELPKSAPEVPKITLAPFSDMANLIPPSTSVPEPSIPIIETAQAPQQNTNINIPPTAPQTIADTALQQPIPSPTPITDPNNIAL